MKRVIEEKLILASIGLVSGLGIGIPMSLFTYTRNCLFLAIAGIFAIPIIGICSIE